MGIWTPHYIKENYSCHSLTTIILLLRLYFWAYQEPRTVVGLKALLAVIITSTVHSWGEPVLIVIYNLYVAQTY